MDDIDSAWTNFCDVDDVDIKNEPPIIYGEPDFKKDSEERNLFQPMNTNSIPKCSSLYISTKTIISYLNCEIDLKNVFWEIPIIPYHLPSEGVVKKQMKFNSTTQEEVDIIINKSSKYYHVNNHIITRIVHPEGRIKFKDIRKVSIGLSKKDIISHRCKQKGAFYNCFVMEIRFMYENLFREIHIKVFNTGKLEIPGIKTPEILDKVLNILCNILRPIINPELTYVKNINEIVLINSNFNCGYFINREKLYDILKYKYKINSAYDPCSYPGIQCEFYYNPTLEIQTGRYPSTNMNKDELKDIRKMSFMVFRTGSVLIVGKCCENILQKIYDFIKNILETEYLLIGTSIISKDMLAADKVMKQKHSIRKKIIYVSTS